jgi:hypothetical protein
MTLTDKQKKGLMIAGLVLVLIHFAPRFLNMFNPLAGHAAAAKPSPVRYAPAPAPLPPPPPPSPEAIALARYAGVWGGDGMIDQNRCTVRLEIRLNDDLPKKLKGYEQKSCVPLQPFAGGKLTRGSIADAMRDTATVSAVMTGKTQEGGMNFSVDQVIGYPDKCPLTAFSITDFGSGLVMAQWQEGTCPAGKMVLRKARG